MSNKRPNIVLIVSDQQRHDALGVNSPDYVITPNLDRLCQRGVRFTHAFAAGATCVASRAALFTGMYAHNTGVYSFDQWTHHPTWVSNLRRDGYYCASIGKMHCLPVYSEYGFDERQVVENKTERFTENGLQEDLWGKFLNSQGIDRPTRRRDIYSNWAEMCNSVVWEYPDAFHADSFVGDLSVNWVKSHTENGRPFFLEIGFPGPHEPYDPPQHYLDLYSNVNTPAPAIDESELDGKPPQQRRFQENFEKRHDADSMIRLRNRRPEELSRMRKHYHANVTLIDEQVGRILNTLAATGHLDNTVVMFTSDHGDNLGDHGLPYKWFMYDSCVRVPMIVADFRVNRPESGTIVDALVSLVDVGPTILEYAGSVVPSRLEGKSLLPYIERGRDAVRRSFVISEDNYLVMIRSSQYKLVEYIGQPYGELYDLASDPDEKRNLWVEQSGSSVVTELREWLLHFYQESCYKNAGYKHGRGDIYATKLPNDPRFGDDLVLVNQDRKVYGTTV